MKTCISAFSSRRFRSMMTVTVLGAACLASGLSRAGAEAPKPVRGEPIRPVAGPARGEPIQALKAVAPAATDPAKAPAAGASSEGGFLTVGFDKLSAFKYDVPEDGGATNTVVAKDPDSQIPAEVKAFNGRRVALKGFMLPLKVEGGLVTELLIMRDQSMCCYGAVPKINEWVSVKMTSKGVKPVMDQAVTLQGTLKVGAMRENGYLVGIYQMDGERVNPPRID